MGNAQPHTIPKVVIKKIINAKRDRVFAAWTQPELMKEWLVGRQDWTARTKNELRVGGRYHHEMIVGGTAGNKTSDGCNPGVEFEPGAALLHEGEYLEISPPERLVFTWNSPSVKNTRVTVELRDLGDSTELWLTHELLETEDLRRSHTGGWNTCLEKLEHFLTA